MGSAENSGVEVCAVGDRRSFGECLSHARNNGGVSAIRRKDATARETTCCAMPSRHRQCPKSLSLHCTQGGQDFDNYTEGHLLSDRKTGACVALRVMTMRLNGGTNSVPVNESQDLEGGTGFSFAEYHKSFFLPDNHFLSV